MNKLNFALSNIYLLFITFCHRDIVHVYFSPRIWCSYKKHSCCVQWWLFTTAKRSGHSKYTWLASSCVYVCSYWTVSWRLDTIQNWGLRFNFPNPLRFPCDCEDILKFLSSWLQSQLIIGFRTDFRIWFRKDIRSIIELTFSYNCKHQFATSKKKPNCVRSML